MSKQDRHGARTIPDLERKYNFGEAIRNAMTASREASRAAQEAKDALESINSTPFATESVDYPGCYYRVVDGEVEWLNPPMIPGEEYRTAERHNGKVVYAKLIDAGTLPNATYNDIPIGAEITSLVELDVEAIYTDGSWRYKMPFYSATGVLYCHACVVNSNVRIYAVNYDASAYTGEIRIRYTKA